jgi:hypothetical protein
MPPRASGGKIDVGFERDRDGPGAIPLAPEPLPPTSHPREMACAVRSQRISRNVAEPEYESGLDRPGVMGRLGGVADRAPRLSQGDEISP